MAIIFTPAELKAKLENIGYETMPLSDGKLAGIMFEDGGGYKVLFGKDGLFQYHPEFCSHHGGAYYKISKGTFGKRWYNLRGELIEKKEPGT